MKHDEARDQWVTGSIGVSGCGMSDRRLRCHWSQHINRSCSHSVHRDNFGLCLNKWIGSAAVSHCAGTVQMREKSESGIRKWEETWFKTTAEDGEREVAVTCDGRLFHRRAAATGNPVSPTVDRRVGLRRTSRDVDEADAVVVWLEPWVSAGQPVHRPSQSHYPQNLESLLIHHFFIFTFIFIVYHAFDVIFLFT